jgi:apolipoprotein D and lipocalin family protein
MITTLRTRLHARSIWIVGLAALLTACHNPSAHTATPQEPLRALDRPIDLERFMGDWHVIAHIPVFIEKDAYNAVESYALAPDGTIPTTYVFNQGGFDGPLKTYRPRGFIHNTETNTEWRMRFIWPFKSPYLIIDLDHDYQTTIIGVPDRKYAWIMARTKTLPEKRYQELVAKLAESGHDTSRLRRVPHQ